MGWGGALPQHRSWGRAGEGVGVPVCDPAEHNCNGLEKCKIKKTHFLAAVARPLAHPLASVRFLLLSSGGGGA